MSAYHAFELCYLAAVYTNLLIKKQPMDFYFKPKPGAFKDNILRVQPDILPPGSVRLEEVWINGDPYKDFDPVAMTVKLPAIQEQQPLKQRPDWAGNPHLTPRARQELKVRVRMVPTGMLFDAALDLPNDVAVLTLSGNLDKVAEPVFKAQLDKIVAAQPKQVVLHMEDLQTMSIEAARALSFIKQKLPLDENISVVGVNPKIKGTLQSVGVWEELNISETDDITKREKSS
jgi:anti-anti-sigma factor